MSNPTHRKSESDSALASIKLSNMILPILIGLAVVVYMISTQLEYEALLELKWDAHTILWIFLAAIAYVVRHILLSYRLRVMTSEAFTWKKAIHLIILWEFASAVSPTTIGGSGVALFFLSQEKLTTAKTVSVVLYSMVLDTLFFVLSLSLAYLIIGAVVIRPGMIKLSDMDGFGLTFLSMLLFMLVYGGIFFYGLFINPEAIKKFLFGIARLPFINKWKRDIQRTGIDIMIAAREISSQKASFHLRAFISTIFAWVLKFFVVNCIIISLISEVPMDVLNQAIMVMRGASMHVITSFSPTPGGAGIAEYLFGGFYSDYIRPSIASLIALIWRLLTYYSYLIAGAIIIPVWVAGILKKHRSKK